MIDAKSLPCMFIRSSGSSNSAPQIVDEEALALTGKSKGKEKMKKDGKKNLDVSMVKFFYLPQAETLFLPVPR